LAHNEAVREDHHIGIDVIVNPGAARECVVSWIPIHSYLPLPDSPDGSGLPLGNQLSETPESASN